MELSAIYGLITSVITKALAPSPGQISRAFWEKTLVNIDYLIIISKAGLDMILSTN